MVEVGHTQNAYQEDIHDVLVNQSEEALTSRILLRVEESGCGMNDCSNHHGLTSRPHIVELIRVLLLYQDAALMLILEDLVPLPQLVRSELEDHEAEMVERVAPAQI